IVIFFFQAEDGIRDRTVTGVQTCALPILTEKELDSLIADFELYIRNRTVRVYYFLNLKNALKQNRGLVQDIMKKAEEDAYKQYEIGRASCRERGKVTVGDDGI